MIFISHSEKDKAAYTSLLAALKSNNLDYWNPNAMRAGGSLKDQLRDAISRCHICIFIATRSSIKSKWCLAETGAFWGAGKRIILYKADPDIELPPLFRGDLSTSDINQVIEQIEEEMATADKTEQLSSSSCQRNQKDELEEQARFDSGIILKDDLGRYPKQIPGEVFAIELLTETINFKRVGGHTIVTIDRRNADECIITTAGKTKAVQKYVAGNEDKLRRRDEEIQDFLIGASSETNLSLNLEALNLRLRWASGGVLSIVTINGQDYAPLFFRDIPPYGWNISLGSSERFFNEDDGTVDPLFPIENEWDHPLNYIRREFLEESFVIDRAPDPKTKSVFKIFEGGDPLQPSYGDRVRRFARELTTHREVADKLSIDWNNPSVLRVAPGEGNASIAIISSSEDRRLPPTENVLVAFSLLDLGIEVVQVYKYSLEPNDYMLDGEVLVKKNGEKELVRMPIALFSCRYLTRTFGNNREWRRYTVGPQPSIEVERALTANDVHLFTWDVRRRIEILKNSKQATEWEIRRFHDWYYKFAREHFVDRGGEPSSESLPRLFTPATAKIFNQYFSMPDVHAKYSAAE